MTAPTYPSLYPTETELENDAMKAVIVGGITAIVFQFDKKGATLGFGDYEAGPLQVGFAVGAAGSLFSDLIVDKLAYPHLSFLAKSMPYSKLLTSALSAAAAQYAILKWFSNLGYQPASFQDFLKEGFHAGVGEIVGRIVYDIYVGKITQL